ncbi:uncharacterized protein LOC133332281, partial [Musca vetustissima]|uniref:uncharacterized protein LOC133332281 n=1 Tax=Musca vetustissima TaxID=27455 RepID=UPI002AB77682
MPVSGFEYTTRPYSSFRGPRGSCAMQHHTTATYLRQQPTTNSAHHSHHNCTKISLNGGNPLQTSSSASSIAPMRTSFYGTRYNHKVAPSGGDLTKNSNSNGGGSVTTSSTTTVSVKPLTPKLVKRIETTCSQTHNKARDPNPPTAAAVTSTSSSTTTTNGVNSTPPTAHKQYLRPRNLPPTPPQRKSSNFDRFHQTNLSIRQKTSSSSNANNTNTTHANCSSAISSSNGSQESLIPKAIPTSSVSTQKRAYANTVSKIAKENQPKELTQNGSHHNGPAKSIKSYPAPLPPTASFRRKCKEESSASPNLNQRRFISSVGINSFNASCNAKALPSPAMGQRNRTTTTAHNSSAAPGTPTFGRNKPTTASTTRSIGASSSNYGQNKNYSHSHQQHSSIMAHKTGSTGSNSSSNQSSGSQGSPKSKKAFSTKFPQGLPFEDEFYRRNRSYSQSSSSNYSFYSSNGGGGGRTGDNATTPPTPRDYDEAEDDEFQRKPSNDEPLYVDFTKVINHHQHKTTNGRISPQTTWIGGPGNTSKLITNPSTNYDSSLNSPHSQRRCSHLLSNSSNTYQHNHANNSTDTLNTLATANSTTSLRSRTKYSTCINDYLYASNGKLSNNVATPPASDSRKSLLYSSKYLDPYHQADNGYYTHASPDSSPPPPSTSSHQTDIYKAVASWAPKCSHPTKVRIPSSSSAADSNNNNQKEDYIKHRYLPQHEIADKYYVSPCIIDKSDDVLESTNREY